MELTKNLAYLLGALRDGSVLRYSDKQGKIHHYITFYSKDTKWLNFLSKLLKKTFSGNQIFCKPRKGTPYLRIYSKKIAIQIQKEFDHPLKSQITWKTPKILMDTGNKEIIKWYIGGFWDAEGGFDIRTHQIRFHLSWNGLECPPLNDIKRLLRKLNISSGNVGIYKNKNGNYPRFVLRVSKKDNKNFIKNIPIFNPSKKRKIGILAAK